MKKKYLLAFVCLLLTLTPQAQFRVIIAELLYDTPLSESGGSSRYNGEFATVYNYGRDAVDVSGWSLVSDGAGQTFVFPEGSIMQSGAKFVVAYRNMQSNFSLLDLYIGFKLKKKDREFYQRSIIHANEGESLRLYRCGGVMQDSIYYEGASRRSKVPRLEALNENDIPGNQCVSIQRCNVTRVDTSIIFNPLDYVVRAVALSRFPTSMFTENGEPVLAKLSYAYDASGNRVSRTIVLPPVPEVVPLNFGAMVAGKSRPIVEQGAAVESFQNANYYTDRLDKGNVIIYPNPTKGVLAVELRNVDLKEVYQLLIYSLNGTLVLQQSISDSYTTVDLTSQPKGVYIMRILSPSFHVNWKILKE